MSCSSIVAELVGLNFLVKLVFLWDLGITIALFILLASERDKNE